MANYRAIVNGNWSNLATWQDDSLGYFTTSTVLPTSADNVYSNNFTVTIDGVRNANLISNTAFTGPTFLGAMSIPLMTSNLTPSGVASVSSNTNQFGGLGAYGAFDRNGNTFWESSAFNTAWLSYQFPTGKIIKKYGFFILFNTNQSPRTWTFEASNNGTTWTTLDTQTNFTISANTFYPFDISTNTTSYTYYRINVTVTQGGGRLTIPSLEMSEITDLYGFTVVGGRFIFANGGDLTCGNSPAVFLATTTPVLEMNLASPNTATFRGSVLTINNIQNSNAILLSSSGTLNLIGNYTVDGATTNSSGNKTLINSTGNGTLNIVGNLNNVSFIGGSQSSNTVGLTGGVLNLTGSVANSSSTGVFNGTAYAIGSTSATINITGNITNQSSKISIGINGGTINVIGNTTGGSSQPAISNFTSNATVNLLGITTSGSGVAAVSGLFGTFVIIRGNVVNTDTYSAIYAGRIVINDNVTSWQFKDSTNTIIRTLYTAGVALGNPATSNVRFGTTYGASLELTGTMRVPSAANVLQGVLVDNTVGTLLMTPAQCWNYLISSGFTPNSIGDRLQNASTVATTGSQIASYNI